MVLKELLLVDVHLLVLAVACVFEAGYYFVLDVRLRGEDHVPAS